MSIFTKEMNVMSKNERLYVTDYNHKTFERQRKIITSSNNKVTGEKTVIAVKLEREIDNTYIIDPIITSFLKEEFWDDVELNTQKRYASVICTFLNYCRFCTYKKVPDFINLNEGIFNLKFYHGSMFLKEQVDRHLSGELTSNTVNQMEYPILRFYHFLLKTKVIKESVEGLYEDNVDKGTLTLVYNPFRDSLTNNKVSFPKKTTEYQPVRDFTDISAEKRLECINLMIDIAKMKYRDIALALCFMFYGGLRLGEVVNLSRKGLEKPKYYDTGDYGKNGFVLLIEDNPELFEGFKTKANNQVKRRTKYVAVEPIGWDITSIVFEMHKNRIAELEAKKKINSEKALFYCYRTGNPLMYHTAYYQFKQLAEKFIETLVDKGDKETLENLTESKTGDFKITPHLCRAVFTNLGIDLGYTKEQLRVRRGDSTFGGIEFYWNQKMVKQKRQETLNQVQTSALNTVSPNEEGANNG
jgi:hypothetical protein